MKVSQVYNFLNEYAPFSLQDSFDNSGLLVGDENATVKGICLSLDITNAVIEEAAKRKANLIVSHHPVIFDPIKSVTGNSPVYNLAKHKMSAICMHTNTDIAENGICDIMGELLGFEKSSVILHPVHGENGYGRIHDLPIPTTAAALAEVCKNAFDCTIVRYVPIERQIKRVGVVSGAGGCDIPYAIKAGCDALITGDIKHHQWLDAKDAGLCLIDAGHFHTENILCNYLSGILSRKFHNIQIFTAENSCDPCAYII